MYDNVSCVHACLPGSHDPHASPNLPRWPPPPPPPRCSNAYLCTHGAVNTLRKSKSATTTPPPPPPRVRPSHPLGIGPTTVHMESPWRQTSSPPQNGSLPRLPCSGETWRKLYWPTCEPLILGRVGGGERVSE